MKKTTALKVRTGIKAGGLGSLAMTNHNRRAL